MHIAIGDLVMTFSGVVGVVTDIMEKGLCLSTFENDIKIFCKDIKKIRYVKPMCLKHNARYCELCNQKYMPKNQ